MCLRYKADFAKGGYLFTVLLATLENGALQNLLQAVYRKKV